LGGPEAASWRLASKIREIAAAKLSLQASIVFPWPFAPGTSGQQAIYQSSSFSMMAANSLYMLPSVHLLAFKELEKLFYLFL
jgi:hypothetical protein